MTSHASSPGGRYMAWLYRIAIGLALFGGMGQMPIYQRYYLTSLPGMAWAADFYILSDLHYIAAAMLIFIFSWRMVLALRTPGLNWSWGPRTWWGWSLLGLLAITGAEKAIYNLGLFMSPQFFLFITLTHLGAAMLFMITGIVTLFMKRKPV